MKVLVINAGSSSLKYQLIDMDSERMLAKGNCERIGMDGSIFIHKTSDGRGKRMQVPMKDHTDAFMHVTQALTDPKVGVIKNLDEVSAIGHRVAQGGSKFRKSVLVNDEVIQGIRSLIPLAPLHNGPELDGILACEKVFGEDVPEVVVFDTSFHSTMPPKAYMYAIPYEYYEKYGIRRYGFHGTSHRYVSRHCAHLMHQPLEDIKMVTCHIGNGSSIAAIQDGRVIDTSMGLTPLDGFMMGTRCGAIDPAIVPFVMEHEGLTAGEMNDLMNKKSGLLGISGISNDLRSVRDASEQGHERAMLAYDMYSNSVKKYIGQYIAVMGGVDAIVLTAGVGENCEKMRRMIFAGLQPLGMILDEEKNRQRGFEREISTESSPVKIIIIPTNEEYMIARDTYEILHEKVDVPLV